MAKHSRTDARLQEKESCRCVCTGLGCGDPPPSPTHPLPLLGRYKGSPSATQLHFSTMNPLLILAFVGAAGESHALLWAPFAPVLGEIHAPPFLLPFLFSLCAEILPSLSSTPPSHSGALFKPHSLTFCRTPLPSPSSINFGALLGEARKGDQVGMVCEMSQDLRL